MYSSWSVFLFYTFLSFFYTWLSVYLCRYLSLWVCIYLIYSIYMHVLLHFVSPFFLLSVHLHSSGHLIFLCRNVSTWSFAVFWPSALSPLNHKARNSEQRKDFTVRFSSTTVTLSRFRHRLEPTWRRDFPACPAPLVPTNTARARLTSGCRRSVLTAVTRGWLGAKWTSIFGWCFLTGAFTRDKPGAEVRVIERCAFWDNTNPRHSPVPFQHSNLSTPFTSYYQRSSTFSACVDDTFRCLKLVPEEGCASHCGSS